MIDIDKINIKDPVYKEPASFNFIEKFFINMLNDKRDLAFIKLCGFILVTTVPMALSFYIPGFFRWWMLPIYFAFNVAFTLGPFILMLHLTSHRPLFKKEYKFLNNFIPWVLGPFFGETPESYFAHHVGMHHAEDNMPTDHSSTMQYQRDSFIDFMKYYLTFIALGTIQLAGYLKGKNRKNMHKNFLTGEISFWIFAIGMCFVNLEATLAAFIIPVFVVRFLMMAGNWGQHAFVDARNPKNNYTSAINCINSYYNRTCFNDGYHIVHHLKPAMHWTEYPGEFLRNTDRYAREDAFIFEKLDFHMVWFFLMFKRYDWLANSMVRVRGSNLTDAQAIALMKERTKKIVSVPQTENEFAYAY